MLLDLMVVLVDTYPDHLGSDHGSNSRFGLLLVACLHTCSTLVASGILDSARVIVAVSLIFSHTVVRGLDLVPGLIQSSRSYAPMLEFD
jgi:hypothetical protein